MSPGKLAPEETINKNPSRQDSTRNLDRPRIGVVDILFATFFTLALISGYVLSTYHKIDIRPLPTQVVWACVWGSIVIWGFTLFILTAIKQRTLHLPSRSKERFLANISDRNLWLVTSLAIFIFYIPIISLGQSVLTPDSWSSVRQSIGADPLYNLQPLIFTTFVGVFTHLGQWLGSLSLGFTLFSLAQSLLLSMIFAKIIVWMREQNIGWQGVVATFIFYAILPINAVAGIIMWKDILFAGFGLLLLRLIQQIYIEKDSFFKKKKIALYVLLAFLFCTWRHNGIYAYIGFLLLSPVVSHQIFFHKKAIALLIAPLLISMPYFIITSLVAGPSPLSETLSIPIQQIARTVKYHNSSLSKEDKNTINEVLPVAQIGNKYNPNLSDPVKYSFNNKVFKAHKAKYIGLYTKLFMESRKTYIAGFAYNTYGYIYPYFSSPDTTATVLTNTVNFNTLKGYKDASYGHGTKPVLAEYRALLLRFVPLFANIGFYTFLVMFGAYIAIIRKRQELIGVFILLACLFATTLLGPENGEFRYLYLFVVATPFILTAAYSDLNQRKA